MTLLDNLTKGISSAQDALSNNENPLSDAQRNQFKSDGFAVPATFSADGNGLPYTKINPGRAGQLHRNIITWFVPEFGTVRMYVNPNSISYVNKKIINADLTKGGYTLQYWGEELTNINISGTTGSSGVEGINMLYEIYRSEQYGFDAAGLTLDANNASADVANNLVNGVGGAIGSAVGGLFGANDSVAAAGGAGLLGGVLGLDSPNNSLAAKNIPSLAQLAFSVEMYYNGWVFRGFFRDMTITETADNFLWQYQITFTATQRRGYRANYFPFHKSANNGPSQYETPNSFDKNLNLQPQKSLFPVYTPGKQNKF